MALQGSNNEANVLAESYSLAQNPRESGGSFCMDELQLLARKVISKKPEFWQNLDATLKQHYANQLFDHNNASIAKTLSLQMPKVTFTQYRNELARVFGTCQCSKPSTKAVSVSIVESNLGNDVAPSKTHAEMPEEDEVLKVPRFRICIVSWTLQWLRILRFENYLTRAHCRL